jgi:cytochrome c551/c552
MLPEIQNHLLQLKWLLIILIALICPLLALMLGGTTVSLASTGLTRRTGKKEPPAWVNALLERANPSVERDTLVVLTVLASLLLFKIIYRPQLFSNTAWATLILLLATGLGLMVTGRHRLSTTSLPDRTALMTGSIGIALVSGCCFALACTESLLLTPEYWPQLARLPYLFLSWHGLVRFIEFILLTAAMTGNALLFTLPPQVLSDPEQHGNRVAKSIGAGLILGALFLWPLALCLEMSIIPALTASRLLSGLAILSIGLAAGAATWLLVTLQRHQSHPPRPFFVMVLLLFWCWAFMGHVAREQILFPAALAGLNPEPAQTTPLPSQPADSQPSAPPPVMASGQILFEQKCSICHRFDQRVVGPPLNSVVPKYRSNLDQLKHFLKNPEKRDPDYPNMPNLGLTDEEATSIAGYLLQHVSP